MKKNKKGLLCKLIFILCINSYCVFSQDIEWQNTIGGSGDDKLFSIHQTSDGGYILGGASDSGISGDKSENSLGARDYWIVKIDSLGNMLWENTIGGTSEDVLRSVQQTTDGGYILGGTSYSSIGGDKTENSLGFHDYWVVKTDSIGNIQWQNTIGGGSSEELNCIQQTSDGGYILGGNSESNISGDKTENCIGLDDFWIVKLDSLGNIQWQNTIGGNNGDYLNSVKQTNDGGYILGGFSYSDISGDKTESCIGNSDYWIVKLDDIGTVQWQNTIGGSLADQLISIRQASDGGYILGGVSSSNISGDKSENSFGGSDCWIIKMDSAGNIQWQNTIGGNGIDGTSSIEQSIDGGYSFGGWSSSSISGDKTENSIGYSDYWMVKIDDVGNIQIQNSIGGSVLNDLNCFELTADGGYVLGGQSNSNISGDKTEDCIGLYDYWIVKLTSKYNLITGRLFADLNSNGVHDSGELPLSAQKITEQVTGNFTYSDHQGNYTVSVQDTGSFTVSPQFANWYNHIPTTQAAAFSGINQTDSFNDFAFQPQGLFEDVCVTITPLRNFSSGMNATYALTYLNKGTISVLPTMIFYLDTNQNYLSATITPTSVNIDSIVWNLPALPPLQFGTIIITVNVDAGILIGTPINSSLKIEPLLNDADPANNIALSQVLTTASFDPNDILVNEDTLTTTQLSNAPWLEYIIRFQNTGNDTAFTVKILNPIDTNKLNLSTFEFTNASHPVNLNWINYQRNMEFKFENILLPDSNTNEPLSHGFVRYRIQPKTTLSAGDSITNFAAIYFDFNEPVITNTAKTIIILPTSIASATPSQGKLHVFPNPAENTINISGIQLENGKAQLRLTDIYGKLIFEKTVTSTTSTLETNQLSNGIYLIQSVGMRATFVKQ
jgi:hypothetical protein